ncbi:MAPEG family protein [Marivibrio halodurans]|uniref:MAPEG family protein n=1 Tax=Marivibrio halodurans TaxID=2039722 RepID=A0A8J7V2U9_9PROT|nr:MAPEG family protein [Marivibrio halodurans]MBP5856144.1 MAPEG family protein [Marivibrio halodurans]
MDMTLAFPVTALYAGLLAILHVILAGRIPPLRYKAKVGIGDGGDPALTRAIRVHGNFIENVPIALVVMALAEANGLGPWTHLLGAPLLIGRAAHAVGLGRSAGPSALRLIGMVTAWGVILLGGLVCLAQVHHLL